MGIADVVSVAVIVSSTRTAQTAVFNVPLVAAYHTHNADRVRIYPVNGFSAAMIADGFSTTEPAYKAVATIASQEPAPSQVAVGRCANKPLQTVTLTIGDATQGDIIGFTLVGSDGASHAISYTIPNAATTTSVATAVAALINAIAGVSTTIGTVTAAGAVITISRTDGALTDVQFWQTQSTLTSGVVLQNTTADPGIAADLAAIQAANSLGWYSVSLASNSAAEVAAAAAYVESTGQGGKVGFFDNADGISVTSSTSDIFSTLQGQSRVRSFVVYDGQTLLSFAGAAAASVCLALAPGSYTAAFKALSGPTADTDTTLTETERLILNTASTNAPGNGGKNGNYYVVIAGNPVVNPGATPSGSYIDRTIFLDWFQVNVQADIFNVLIGLPKLPMTDFGLTKIYNAIKKRIIIGGSADFGGIDLTQGYTITVPTAASLTPTQRAQRNVSGISAQFTLSDAIQTVELTVQVAP